MKIKTIIMIALSAMIILTLLYFLFFYNNKNKQDIVSFLKLPITEDQILQKEICAHPEFTSLILYVDRNIKIDNLPLYDIASHKGSKGYDNLAMLIHEHGMSMDEVEIRFWFVEHSIKDGLFSELVFANQVYVIKRNGKDTIIYTTIPKGVILPYDYRPQ